MPATKSEEKSSASILPVIKEQVPEYFVIIYYPEMERKTSGLPFGMRGDRLFWYQESNYIPEETKLEKVDLNAVNLKKGVNFVDGEPWSKVKDAPDNLSIIKKLMASGAIVEYSPDKTSAAKDTTDYESVDTVEEIVNNSFDKHWLQMCLHVENERIGVRKIIGNRLREVDEMIAAQKQKIAGAFS